jgi:predicted nuclease of predicted toxin-antitoxin system
MRFLLDESAEARIGVFLTERGHDATRIGRDYPLSLPDEEVLALARGEQRILITNDKDFGELVFHQHHPHAGVIFFRFPLDSTAQAKIHALAELLTSHPGSLTQFVVLSPQGIRMGR